MFWKRFRQAHSAGKLFAQANECWNKHKRFLLEGNQKAADESRVEVIRLCQLAIEHDERLGDAYILLANVLMSMAFQISEQAEPSRRDYLMSRAMATIHLWHSLSYRHYPISKNAKIGEQIWKTAVQELINSKSLSEADVLDSLDSYRDTFASNTISSDSFVEIKETILGRSLPSLKHNLVSREDRIQKLEASVEEFKRTLKQSAADLALGNKLEELLDKHICELGEVWQSIAPEQREKLFSLFFKELEHSSRSYSREIDISRINRDQMEVMATFIVVFFLIGYLWKLNVIDSDDLRKYLEYQAKVMSWKLNSISVEPRFHLASLETSLRRIITLWGEKHADFDISAESNSPDNNERNKASDSGYGDESKRHLDEKFQKLHRIATKCDIATPKLKNDIADSMEIAGKATHTHPEIEKMTQEELSEIYWSTFLQEWGCRCFNKYLRRCEDLKDSKIIHNQWFSNFEPMWEVGCEIARNPILNNMKKGFASYVSHRSERMDKNDEEHMLQFISRVNKEALKPIDTFREKQRAFIHNMDFVTHQNTNSILDNFKRVMSE